MSVTTFHPNDDFRDSIATVDADGKRVWLYPKQPSGPLYRARKWISYGLLALLFAGPWLRFRELPLLMLNLPERKFIILGQIFWPQDFFILLIGALTFLLFIILFTIVYGRIFCGWVCPQTIFLEFVFRRIEYWLEGDAPQQKALDRADWTWNKIWRKTSKHALFLLISFLIANTFLAYIIGSDALVKIVTDPLTAHLGGLTSMVVFTGVFYAVFARFREQVCTIACPYGRLQGVLLDKDSLVVAYDYKRGEPREKLRKNQQRTAGDCIDCHQCVQVCPTGIDIRNGAQQLECTNCTACIDACNNIMAMIDLPKGLIRHASENDIANGTTFRLTGRMKVYSGVLVVLLSVLTFLLVSRSNVQATVLRTPGQLFQKTERGTISNLYNISVINKTNRPYPITLRVLEPAGGTIALVGKDGLTLPAQGLTEGVFFAELPKSALHATNQEIRIGVFSGGQLITETDTKFLGPPQ
ncbi:cytochrome c oxidase accessory protein CcoG [Hymenobacter lutimineralis]|uniref:Cytochrome c oxidase accessory protein CcoG n=1 Tax=Hymenobacter lutimineralis TaxID=2606448 RepID=A0A5D6UTV1_9BACT|nr:MULTISPECIES: cytochrome c oxidase accessory protein CcoG [Hymenobacter]QIX62305.1 cytochrome c oxidase accessory protein CcoG [Hymenobacter sp. BT18]TYZ06913.1 cytochrome c oxidase accessory protein CcoG [Hymenobacter lutimineralis]